MGCICVDFEFSLVYWRRINRTEPFLIVWLEVKMITDRFWSWVARFFLVQRWRYSFCRCLLRRFFASGLKFVQNFLFQILMPLELYFISGWRRRSFYKVFLLTCDWFFWAWLLQLHQFFRVIQFSYGITGFLSIFASCTDQLVFKVDGLIHLKQIILIFFCKTHLFFKLFIRPYIFLTNFFMWVLS